MGKVEVWLQAFLVSVLEADERTPSRSSRLSLGDYNSRSGFIRTENTLLIVSYI